MGPYKLYRKVKQAHSYKVVFRKRVLQLKCEYLHNKPCYLQFVRFGSSTPKAYLLKYPLEQPYIGRMEYRLWKPHMSEVAYNHKS